MIGVALLSFFVWQHHLFQSGIDPDMRPLFMLTTELISIPTGFLFLVTLGTLWKAKIRFEVPMLFCLAMLFNFLIGGITGVFLSDVPVDVTVHGSFFVMAHFHYTIMGGLIFALFGGLYYWLPKMTGKWLNQRLARIHFWAMFIFFNCTFFPLFLVGLLGQPRRVFEYAPNLQTLNDISSVSAYLLGASFLIFIFNFVWSVYIDPVQAPDNPWDSRGLEWQTPTPVPWFDFERIPVVLSDPYRYGEPEAPPVADLGVPSLVTVGAVSSGEAVQPERARVASRATRRLRPTSTNHLSGDTMADRIVPSESFPMLRETPEEIAYELRAHEGALWTGSRMAIGIWAFAFAALGFAYFYLRSANNADAWRPAHITAPTGLGAAVLAFSLAAALLAGYGLWRFRLGSALDWEVAGWTSVLCALGAVGLQIFQLTQLPFLPRRQRLLLVLCRVGPDERRAAAVGRVLARDVARPPDAPKARGHRGRGHGALHPPRSAALPGEPRRLHQLLGVHRVGRAVLLGALLRVVTMTRRRSEGADVGLRGAPGIERWTIER